MSDTLFITQTIRKNIEKNIRWFTPGMGVKRWILLIVIGSVVLGIGGFNAAVWLQEVGALGDELMLIRVVSLQWMPRWLAGAIGLLFGIAIILFGVWRLGLVFIAPFRDGADGETLAEKVFSYQSRNLGPKIVAIGGGTGLSNLLRGLSQYTRNVTAIVTVADDGGSSGRLRRDFGILPPGDFRNNLAALSRDEALMTQLLQYRFGKTTITGETSELGGHAFGNLLIAALVGLTGSFEDALLAAQRVLAIRGRVLPSTLTAVTLEADIWVGDRLQRISGESEIPKVAGQIDRVFLTPAMVPAYPSVRQAIFEADLIVMGPGSLFTSLLPNLLVPDLVNALCNARARKVFIANVANQQGETDGFSLSRHVNMLLRHVPDQAVDIVLANRIMPRNVPDSVEYVELDIDAVKPKVVLDDLIDEVRPWRHDNKKLSEALLRLLR